MSSWTRVSLKERICSASQMGGSMLRAPAPPPGTLPRGGGAEPAVEGIEDGGLLVIGNVPWKEGGSPWCET